MIGVFKDIYLLEQEKEYIDIKLRYCSDMEPEDKQERLLCVG